MKLIFASLIFWLIFASTANGGITPPKEGDGKVVGKDIVRQWKARRPAGVVLQDPAKKQPLDEAIIVQQFPLEVAASVLADGSKSFAETLSQRNAAAVRLDIELNWLGLDLDLTVPFHRSLVPKYGYAVLPKRPVSAGFTPLSPDWGHSYGGVSAILKPEVKERALWQYGNSGTFHGFDEPLMSVGKIHEPHLEGLVFGTLNAADIERLVIVPWEAKLLAEEREIVRTKKPEDFFYLPYVPSLRKRIAFVDKFLELTRLMKIPLYVGELRYHLKALPEGESYLKDLRLINGVQEGTPRPQLTPEQLKAHVGGIPPQPNYIDMDLIFVKGLTKKEQFTRYLEASSALTGANDPCEALKKLALPLR